MSKQAWSTLIEWQGDILWMWSREKPCQLASNSELRRWLDRGNVSINGARPKPADQITWPIIELTLFPGGKSQTSIVAP